MTRRGRMMFVDPEFWKAAKIGAAKRQKSMVDYTGDIAKELAAREVEPPIKNDRKKKKGFGFGL